MSDLYRLVYASKNFSGTTEADTGAALAQILQVSWRNNARVGVTGALLFNGGAFAQVLEGPRRAVEDTFERIQRDERHGEVTVLQCAPVESRGFADWSMGFVGRSARGQALWSGLASESGFDLGRLDGDAVFAMLHSLVLDEEGTGAASAAAPPRPAAGLDVERVRAELPRQMAAGAQPAADPAQPAPVRSGEGSPSEITLVVLRESLAAERQRTTDLRNSVDGLRVALAHGQERAERLAGERDLWARRAELLATALGREAVAAGARAQSAGADEFPSEVLPRKPPSHSHAA